MRRYKSGLLNLERTPAYLIPTYVKLEAIRGTISTDDIRSVKSNAETPLLRLPAEIRNLIWSFACGGLLVKMRCLSFSYSKQQDKGGAISYPHDKDLARNAKSLKDINRDRRPTKVLSAFHLPEVSRQIYSETVLTSYKENVFAGGDYHFWERKSTCQLNAAQRGAITVLELTVESMIYESVYFALQQILVKPNELLRVLPNLRAFIISKYALRFISLRYQHHGVSTAPYDLRISEQAQAWLRERLSAYTEAGLALVFEE